MATAREVEDQQSDNAGSEDLYELVCQPCHEDGKIREAAGMCIDCQEYLCQGCFDVHKIPRPARNHKLINKEEMLQSQTSVGRKDKCTEKCAEHDEEVIKYYCKNHCQFGCNVCITLDHRTCDGVTYIPKVARDLENNEEYKQAESQLKSILEKANNLLIKANRTTDTFCHECSEAVKMIREFRKEIIDALDKIEADLVEKAEAMKSQLLSKITKRTNQISSAQREVQKMEAITHSLLKNGQNCDLYIFYTKSLGQIQSLDRLFKEIEAERSVPKMPVRFVPNRKFLEMLKDSGTFGRLIETESRTMEPDTDTRTIVRAEYMKDIGVSSHNDTTACCVMGSVVLPDNTILIADWWNSCIKMIDTNSSKVIKELKLLSSPWDVAVITNNQAAVTLPGINKIVFVKPGAVTIVIERKINVSDSCYGIDYREAKLAVTFASSGSVRVLNLEGVVLYDLTQQGQSFSFPSYVAFGHDDSTLYVSNFTSNNVVCVKVDGTLVSTYYDNRLQGPRGLLIDKNGNVYVCGKDSINIHQITPDCRMIQILLTGDDGLKAPLSISYIETENKLIVGMEYMMKVYKAVLQAV